MEINEASYHWRPQSCPICELPPVKYVGQRGGRAHREGIGVETEIWSCGNCGLLFPNPMPIPVNGLAQHYGVDADVWFAAHDETVKLSTAFDMVERAERLLGRTGRLLDVGVGRGEVLAAAKAKGWTVEGVEPSKTFAERVETKIGAKIWNASIEEVELPDESYDCIFLAAVLEHLYDPDIVIGKIAKALRKDGLLYVDVPNERGLYFRAGNIYQKLKGRDWCVNLAPTFSPYHLFGFGPTSLKRLLSKHGLKPKVWTVVAGTSLVPSRGGIAGKLESLAAKAVTAASRFGEMGTYIETWAAKS